MMQKKILLTVHIVFAAIMLGVTVVFLVLSIAAAATRDPGLFQACYRIMFVLADSSLRVSTIGTTVTGILLSVLTHWGLLKYYWIIAKELLTAAAIAINLFGIYFWSLQAMQIADAEALNAVIHPDFAVNRLFLLIGIGFQIVSLVGLFVLSVFKPWGKRASLAG